jgi:DNA-binding NtrC family response regulator
MRIADQKALPDAPRSGLSICILHDETNQTAIATDTVQGAGFDVTGTDDPCSALRLLGEGLCRTILADVELLGMDGFEFLETAMKTDPAAQIILIGGNYTVDSAIEAIKRGAYDYLSRPVDVSRLIKTLDELAELSEQRSQVGQLEQEILDKFEFNGIVGRSPTMLDMFDLVRKVSKHYSNVLITGPTGSGKELVARALHQISPVGAARFAVCNCSALVETLLDSQLFGHMRGSFTGATDTRPGLFEYANGGAVFLDEIGETTLPLQAKLLRVIQNREIQRIGSPGVQKVDVRVIAATNRNLRTEVLAGRFREDLFYRLSTFEIQMPSLSERSEDIPLLHHHLLKKCNAAYGKSFRGFTRRAQVILLRYSWPGNVRELENVVARAAITAEGDFIDVSDLPKTIREQKPSLRLSSGSEGWGPISLEEMNKLHIERVLAMCDGNQLRAAEILGIGRTTLYRYLRRKTRHASDRESACPPCTMLEYKYKIPSGLKPEGIFSGETQQEEPLVFLRRNCPGQLLHVMRVFPFMNHLLERSICESLTVARAGVGRRSNEEIRHCDVARSVVRPSCIRCEANNVSIRICPIEKEKVARGETGSNATVHGQV